MRRSFEADAAESICVTSSNTELFAMSPDEPLLAGRAGSSLLFLSPDDSGWSSVRPGVSATERASLPYPDPPESGPPAALTNGLAFGGGGAAYLVGASEGAISVRFERGDAGRFVVASYFLEPRLTEFIDVAPSRDGGVWALGLDRSGRAFLVKLTSANTLDTNAAGGLTELHSKPVVWGALGTDASGRAVALLHPQADPPLLVRVLSTGVVDPSYGAGGRLVLPLGNHRPRDSRALIVEKSGGALVGGPVLLADGGSHHVGVLRVDATGHVDPTFGGANAPFLLQPGASVIDDLTDDETAVAPLVAAPTPTIPGCEPEFAVAFGQRGGAVYLFQ